MNTCSNCHRPYAPLRKGLCVNCYRYEKRTGQARPLADDLRSLRALRGENAPNWKGDAARTETKRARAQRQYPLGNCEMCGKPATDRHHKNGDTGNNRRSNLAFLCRHCHMKVDGRLAEFVSHRIVVPVKPAQPCANCGRLSKPLRKGLCHTCNEYQRRTGKPRPYIDDGRSEKIA